MRAYKQKITNSSTYNNSLKQRGRLDFWMDKDIFSNWNYKGKQTKGGKVIYSDVAIEIALILSYVYSLPLRQTEGFLSSLLQLHNFQLTVPDYTTLCRRKRTLDVSKKLKKWNGKEPRTRDEQVNTIEDKIPVNKTLYLLLMPVD
jgi:hypothetical protein